jgi:putative endopeptidase
MKINVGYPDKWEDMEKYVNIDESKSLRANYDAIIPALRKAELEKHWKKPVDKTQMACNPQMVNAFYAPHSTASTSLLPFFSPLSSTLMQRMR